MLTPCLLLDTFEFPEGNRTTFAIDDRIGRAPKRVAFDRHQVEDISLLFE